MKKAYITPSIKIYSLLSEGFVADSIKVSDEEIGDDNGDDFVFTPKQDTYWGGTDWQ
ncbi:hypothetical protein [Pseudoprevotella muciniphila]|uniref:hypothetical protein n=1 Tax=Pseudoprevotella muciniphila TaxID=2133944 RepID=UPI0018685190|nr:hypothetical protein [Pseudoprevotella muciniphila]